MNWYSVFYWLTVADGVKKFFDIASNIFTVIGVLSFIAYVIINAARACSVSENKLKNEQEEKVDADFRAWDMARKFLVRTFYPMLVLSIITWIGYVATPTKKDCLLIIAGGAVGNFMASDSSAKQLPSDVTKFLHLSLQEEIRNLDSEIRKDLGVETPKDKLIDKAKQMTKDELIQYLQQDTTLLK